MKKLLLPLVFFFIVEISFGQRPELTVAQIDSIVKHTNATCISGGITDFEIHNKGGRKKKAAGHGADWFYTDTSGTKLLKAARETSMSAETMEVFYFYQDSLIYFTGTYTTYTNGVKSASWTRECYFTGQTIILKQGNPGFPFFPGHILESAREFFRSEQIWKRPFR